MTAPMQRYYFDAIDTTGQRRRGFAEAASSHDLATRLRTQGRFPTTIEEAGHSAAREFWVRLRSPRQPSSKDVALFVQELATLLAAHLPVDRTLSVLAESHARKPLGRVISDIGDRVRRGEQLSVAMSAHGRLFPQVMTSIVGAGETANHLPRVLSRLAETTLRNLRTREAVVSAMIYPAFLMVASFLAIGFILGFVLPQFKPLFDQSHIELDLPSRLLFGLSDLVVDNWWLIAIGFLVIGTTIALLARTPRWRTHRDGAILRLPVLGRTARTSEAARYCRTLGTLLEGGVEMQRATAVAAGTVGNSVLRQRSSAITQQVREGLGLAAPLHASGAFPSTVIQLVTVGEEVGDVAGMLGKAAAVLDHEVEQALARFNALLVPVVTLIIGSFIGAVVAAVFSALMSINDLAS